MVDINISSSFLTSSPDGHRTRPVDGGEGLKGGGGEQAVDSCFCR